MNRPIYLDHAATTPLDERVLEAMLPYLSGEYGNPSSVHRLGRRTRFVVEECRERVAGLIGAEPAEIVFTSGGTEADNLALRGAASSGRIITSAAEHEAVLRTAEDLQRLGRDVTLLMPGHDGVVSVEQVRDALSSDTVLVSIMHANNEVGSLSPVSEMAALCRDRGILFHTDAVQTVGALDVPVQDLGADLLSASAHKFYGPKGAGFLYVRGGVDLHPVITGGSQERRRRGGTENVAAIVGLAEALDLARRERIERWERALALREAVLEELDTRMAGLFRMNTPRDLDRAVPHIINISFPPVDGVALDGEMLLLNLDMEGVMASAGSACTSGAIEPSHVLRAMGVPDDTARASLRFSLGKANTVEEVRRALEVLERTIVRMRRAAA